MPPATGAPTGETVPEDVAAALATSTTTRAKGGRKPKGTPAGTAAAAAGTTGAATDPVADLEALAGTGGATPGATGTGAPTATGAAPTKPTSDEYTAKLKGLYDKAKVEVEASGNAGTSYLQRKLGVGMPWVARVQKLMLDEGLIEKVGNTYRKRTPPPDAPTLESEPAADTEALTEEPEADTEEAPINNSVDEETLADSLARYEQVLNESGIVGEQFDQYMADKRTELSQAAVDLGQIGEGVDLPRQVIKTHGTASSRGRRRLLADREQPQVVIVGRTRGPQEHRAGNRRHVWDWRKAKSLAIELGAALGVTHVEDGVVQAVDRHQAPRMHLEWINISTTNMNVQVFR